VRVLDNTRRLRVAIAHWCHRLKAKRQAAWRDDMRAKLKVTQERKNAKVMKDAWAKWRQSHQSHLSGQHYAERLVLRFLQHWRRRLFVVDHLESAADQFFNASVGRKTEMCWNRWRLAMETRSTERIISERVGLRIMGKALKTWKQHL